MDSCDDPRANQMAPPNWMGKGDQIRLVMFFCVRCSGAFEWRLGALPYPIRCMSCGYGGFGSVPADEKGLSRYENGIIAWPWIHRERARRALLAS